jgi:hypothetical protein
VTGTVIALSIDAAPSYAWLARRCIDSVRASGTTLPIVLFVSSEVAVDERNFGDVDVARVGSDESGSVYLQKWHRLAGLEAERVLYLDVDTVCLRPLELLCRKYVAGDIYARQEAGTQRNGDSAAERRFPEQVHWDALNRQRNPGQAVPVINTGVMLFNHAACSAIVGWLYGVHEVHDAWAAGTTEYPCTNRHIMEELAISSALAAHDGPTVRLLDAADAPYYTEVGAGGGGGIVMHVWTGYYREYLVESGCGASLADYDVQLRRSALRRMRAAGSSREAGTDR